MSNRGLTILVTNLILNGRSGTEIVVRNLALALRDLGHRPIVYSPRLGPIAEELQSSAICVVDDLHGSLPSIDLIHGHHLPATVTAPKGDCGLAPARSSEARVISRRGWPVLPDPSVSTETYG